MDGKFGPLYRGPMTEIEPPPNTARCRTTQQLARTEAAPPTARSQTAPCEFAEYQPRPITGKDRSMYYSFLYLCAQTHVGELIIPFAPPPAPRKIEFPDFDEKWFE